MVKKEKMKNKVKSIDLMVCSECGEPIKSLRQRISRGEIVTKIKCVTGHSEQERTLVF